MREPHLAPEKSTQHIHKSTRDTDNLTYITTYDISTSANLLAMRIPVPAVPHMRKPNDELPEVRVPNMLFPESRHSKSNQVQSALSGNKCLWSTVDYVACARVTSR